MKKVLAVLLVTGFFFAACGGGGQQPAEEKSMGGTASDKGIEVPKEMLAVAKDVVCGMSLETIADTAMVNGKAYPFCSADCKKAFKEHPEKYVVN